MTAPGAEGPQSLLGRLMAVVRAEFRSQTSFSSRMIRCSAAEPAGWPVATAMLVDTGCA